MAIPKSTVPSAPALGAGISLSVNIDSISANSTLDVQINAPRAFRYNRPVFVALDSAATALNTGVQVSPVGRVVSVAGVKKIEFRVSNHTASAIDPTARTFWFWQA